MTTYKYSVPWLELESAAARAVPRATWESLCAKIGTTLPKVDLPETDITPPVVMKGGALVGHSGAQKAEIYRAARHVRGPLKSKAKKLIAGLVARILDEKTVLTDLKAVHSAYLTLASWADVQPSRYAEGLAKWSVTVAASTMFGHTANDRMNPTAAAAKATLLTTAFYKELVHACQVVEAVKLLKSARHVARSKKITMAYGICPAESAGLRTRNRRTARAALPAGFPQVEFWASSVFLATNHGMAVMPTGDMQRLEQYAVAAMNMTAVMLFKAAVCMVDPTKELGWLRTEFRNMSTAVLVVPKDEEVHVCRAYKQAYTASLASRAGRKDAVADAENELRAMPYAHESGALRHYADLKAMTIGMAEDLGKVHKALPASTSLGAATVYGRYLKAHEENPKRPVVAGRPKLDDELFAKCLRDEVTVALRHKDDALGVKLLDPLQPPAWYRAWVDRKVVPQAAGWSRALDLRGSARAPIRSDYAAGAFKDSALAPDEAPPDGVTVAAKTHTNMALRRFVSMDYPSQAMAVAALKSKSGRMTKSDQKSENYKDPLRLFYEATLLDRMGVSWTESAIYSVAKHHPCYMLGKSPSAQQAKAREMISPATGGMCKRFFSFDVSNWSAGMAAKVQRLSGDVWAEVFDDPAVGSAYNTMAGSTVYAQKHGILAGYVSPTANFEGYDGKAMTMVHLALMSATVQRTRQVTKNPDLSVQLMTYIDDGAAALELRTSKAEEEFTEFMACAEEVYGAERFVLHALKCLPSDRMFTFLNEVYYAGAHEVSATKAALRIAAEPKQEHDSLPDRVMTLSSGTQGAVQAGLPNLVAALFCYFLVALELVTWVRHPKAMIANSPVSVALMIASPAAYYGLAVPSARGFDKTGKGASLSEGIAAMQSFALAYPAVKKVVVMRFRTPLPARSYTAMLRNPTGTSGLSVLRTNRISAALAAVAPELAVNPVASQVMRPLVDFDAEAYGVALFGHSTVVSAAAIQMAWKACPMCNAEAWLAKFRSSKTVASMIGRDAMKEIMRQQREDAKLAIAIALGAM
uniref:Uncharacterized protein n=1 Tax=Pseudo-nitzschia australis TaxID=44445 RepID=A0A7S4AL23_9STRA|mmetsp:Transcript_26837/g.58871  ORF Transcript_26837/g.58871 Transcript_26837/m.58871 type:complete len:1038 (+) Transcript_26837:56-3169(+)